MPLPALQIGLVQRNMTDGASHLAGLFLLRLPL